MCNGWYVMDMVGGRRACQLVVRVAEGMKGSGRQSGFGPHVTEVIVVPAGSAAMRVRRATHNLLFLMAALQTARIAILDTSPVL